MAGVEHVLLVKITSAHNSIVIIRVSKTPLRVKLYPLLYSCTFIHSPDLELNATIL